MKLATPSKQKRTCSSAIDDKSVSAEVVSVAKPHTVLANSCTK